MFRCILERSRCGVAEQRFGRLRSGSEVRGVPWPRYRVCTSPVKCRRRDWTSCAHLHSEFCRLLGLRNTDIKLRSDPHLTCLRRGRCGSKWNRVMSIRFKKKKKKRGFFVYLEVLSIRKGFYYADRKTLF